MEKTLLKFPDPGRDPDLISTKMEWFVLLVRHPIPQKLS